MNVKLKKDSKPVLSISLLSSGRKKTIWKCLDSLKPIMEQIFCELIIVDTGCDVETHEKMKEYTDKIIKFTWCNNFSKARNEGLKKAKGEWFMFIDDDEWFSDVTELIYFFKSGEYKKFGSANYIQRNYKDEQGTIYTDSWVSRLIRLDEDTHFESTIHEYLYPVKGICRLLHCPVEHYGYIFKTKKEKYEHSKRNVILLEKLLEEDPTNLRGWTHLIQEYRGIDELSKMKESCLKALEIYQKENNPSVNCARGTFYCGVMIAEISRFNRNEAKYFLEEAIKDVRNTELCKARLYSFGAELSFLSENYIGCIDYCEKYLQIYTKYHDNEIERLKQGSFFVYEAFDKEILNNCYCFYISAALVLDDYTVLEKYFSKLSLSDDVAYLYSTFIEDVVNAFSKIEDAEKYVDYIQVMLNRKGVDRNVFAVTEKIEREDKEKFKNLCRLFAKAQSEYYYIWYLKIRNWGFWQEVGLKDKIYGYYQKLFACVANIFQLDPSVFEIAKANAINLESLFLEISFEQWKAGVDYFCKEASFEKITEQKEIVLSMCKSKDFRFEYFYMKVAERELLECEKEENYIALKEKIVEFSERCINFYSQFYKSNAFEGEMEMLPAICKIAVKLQKVLEREKTGEIKEIGQYLKDCLKVYPPMETTIKKYISLYKEEREKQLEQETVNNLEMKKLAINIKEKIKFFISQEMYQEAKNILEQLKVYIPEDGELEELEIQIQTGNKDKIV